MPRRASGDVPVGSRNEIMERSYGFALRIVRSARHLDRDRVGGLQSQQIWRAGTSIGANVEEAQAAESKRAFVHKMAIARKESREAHYWLRLFRDADVVPLSQMTDLIDECDELVRMLTAIVKSAQTSE